MRILITGGAGFIGRNCAVRLIDAGHAVTCIDSLSAASAIPPTGGVRRIDVRDLTPADFDVDVVLHLAALKSVPGSFHEPTQILHNVAVDHHILRMFTQSRRAKRLVMASSCEVYGDRGRLAPEATTPSPRSPYAVGKVASEHLASVYRTVHPDGEICVLRLHNVFGPDEGGEAVVSQFIDAILEQRPLEIQGDGSQARDFTYIDDACEMIVNVLMDRRSVPHMLNIGSGTATSVTDLAYTFEQLTGSRLVVEFGQSRPNEIGAFVADMTLYSSLYRRIPRRSMWSGLALSLEQRAAVRGIVLDRGMAVT